MSKDQKIRMICGVLSALNATKKGIWSATQAQIELAAEQLDHTQVGTVIAEITSAAETAAAEEPQHQLDELLRRQPKHSRHKVVNRYQNP